MHREAAGSPPEPRTPRKNRSCGAGRYLVVPILGIAASCQSYEPRPLDLQGHASAWRRGNLEVERLQDLVVDLERLRGSTVLDLDLEDGLGLEEGQLVALVHNPQLRLQRLRVGRAAASVAQAGRWTDPQLSLNVLRIAEDVPDPWLLSPGLAFQLPLSGRLGARRELARADEQVEEAALVEAEWEVLGEVRQGWIEWSAARLRAGEVRRMLAAMEPLLDTAATLAELGELPRTEEALLRVERSRRRNQGRRLEAEARAHELKLRALLGISPTAPVELQPALPTWTGGRVQTVGGEGEEDIWRCNPTLERLRQQYERSERALALEVRRQYPDLILGPLYEFEQGQSRFGFTSSLPIPALDGNRKAIAEARVERDLAAAMAETALEGLLARWHMARERAESLESQRSELEQVLVPLLDRQLEEVGELLRLGGTSSLVLLESLGRALEVRLELIDTTREEALARSELDHLLGPPLPRSLPQQQ